MGLWWPMTDEARMRNDCGKILDDLIRFADLVIRIKHAEDGTFV